MPGFELEGFRFAINTRAERGHFPHVHVIKDRTKCKIRLSTALEVYDVVKMRRADMTRARELVAKNYGRLMRLWNQYNG